MLLIVPVLFVNEEIVLRLRAVTGVGHARLLFERFGKFWAALSVTDLFILNALTIATEFTGITFVLDFFGLSNGAGACVAAAVTMAAVTTGNVRALRAQSVAGARARIDSPTGRPDDA